MKIKFHHIVYTFVLGVAIYIGVLITQFNNTDVKNEVPTKTETSIKKNTKQFSIPTINTGSRMDDVFEYFGYVSREMDQLNRLQDSIEGRPDEGDIEKLRDIIFEVSQNMGEMKNKKVPNGYNNIHLNFQQNMYFKEKYFQSCYDYIISKDPKYIEEINNSIKNGNAAWKLVLDELEKELKKDGFNVYRRDSKISVSYEKTKYGF